MFRQASGKFDASRLAAAAAEPTKHAAADSGGLMIGALLARAPLRWLLAFAGGFVLGQAMRDGPWRFTSQMPVRRPADPEWISKPKPGPDGHLGEDALVHHASEDSFPASDPPSYATGRGS
jgi:hypothetical protein